MAVEPLTLSLDGVPGRYDTLETWERHLESLKNHPAGEPLRELLIQGAQDMVARKRRETQDSKPAPHGTAPAGAHPRPAT